MKSRALTASVFACASLCAQAVGPQQAPVDGHRLGGSLLIVGPDRVPGRALDGIFGDLQVGLERALVVPVDEGRIDLDAMLARLEVDLGRGAHFQILRRDEVGYQLSTVRMLGEDPSLDLVQRRSEAEARSIAEEWVVDAAGTDDAPEWPVGTQLGRVTPIYRPDVRGVAFFEFGVQGGGFVVVSTGSHDVPVPNWSSVGRSPTDRLRSLAEESGQQAGRFYRLDSLTYAVEDFHGNLIDHYGEIPVQMFGLPSAPGPSEASPVRRRAWVSWRDLKANYAETYRPLLRQLHLRAEARDVVDVHDGSPRMAGAGWSAWTTFSADGGADQQPLYSQFDFGACKVGCGPVAWAILFGWGDRQAHLGNPTWSGRTGIYRWGGSRTGSSNAVAPLLGMTEGMFNVIRELNLLMSTTCACPWSLCDGAATLPWHMDEAQAYLTGRTGARVRVRYNSATFAEARLRNIVQDSIRDRDTPVVIGNSMGGGKHYPVAYRYRWRSKDTLFGKRYDREFCVNPGWGYRSDFQWVDARTWFAGELLP